MSESALNYVNYVFRNRENDSAFRAAMKNATKENLEWKAWPYIEKFLHEDLKNDKKRHIYALVGEAVAKSGRKGNGALSFGRAMRVAESSNGKGDSYSLRMCRILSFDNLDDLLDVFRESLTFLDSRNVSLDYSAVLDDLLQARFENNYERIKARWASDYFRKADKEDSEDKEGKECF